MIACKWYCNPHFLWVQLQENAPATFLLLTWLVTRNIYFLIFISHKQETRKPPKYNLPPWRNGKHSSQSEAKAVILIDESARKTQLHNYVQVVRVCRRRWVLAMCQVQQNLFSSCRDVENVQLIKQEQPSSLTNRPETCTQIWFVGQNVIPHELNSMFIARMIFFL